MCAVRWFDADGTERHGIIVGFDGGNAIVMLDGNFCEVSIHELTFVRWCDD